VDWLEIIAIVVVVGISTGWYGTRKAKNLFDGMNQK